MGDPAKKKMRISGFDVATPAVTTSIGESTTSKWTGRPYTPKYYEILEKRKGLPVWQQQADFNTMLAANQTLILVGETAWGTPRWAIWDTPLCKFLRAAFVCCALSLC